MKDAKGRKLKRPLYSRRTTSTALQLAVDHAFTGSYASRFRPADPPTLLLANAVPPRGTQTTSFDVALYSVNNGLTPLFMLPIEHSHSSSYSIPTQIAFLSSYRHLALHAHPPARTVSGEQKSRNRALAESGWVSPIVFCPQRPTGQLLYLRYTRFYLSNLGPETGPLSSFPFAHFYQGG